MSPMVSQGEHMFKLCFQTDHSPEPRWLPGQPGVTARRQLMSAASGDLSSGNLSVALDNAYQASSDTHETVKHQSLAIQPGVHNDPTSVTEALDEDSTQQAELQHSGSNSLSRAAVVGGSHNGRGSSSNESPDQAEMHDTGQALTSETGQALSSDTGQALSSDTGQASSSDRIGRVALASEHRKIIQEHISPTMEAVLTCPHYLVYVGTAGQLMQAVQVSDYAPKSSFIPLHWPHAIEQMLVYTFAVSAALALINMAPIWYLDGEAALIEAVKLRGHSDMFYSPAVQPPRVWARLLRLVLGFGTGVFVCVLTLHLIRLLGYDAKVGHMLHTLGKLLSFVLT